MFQPFNRATPEPRTNMAQARADQNRSEIEKARMENDQRNQNLDTFVNSMQLYNEYMDNVDTGEKNKDGDPIRGITPAMDYFGKSFGEGADTTDPTYLKQISDYLKGFF
jgi:hypothetical protein